MASAAPMPDDVAFRLLGGAAVGRVALSARAMPRIVPVRLSLVASLIAAELRSDHDLGAALDRAVVALQADGIEDGTRPWSVHVLGRVTDRSGDVFVVEPSMIEGSWLGS
jgi:hypothetical protein